MKKIIKKLKSLSAKDCQGGFIYRGFEAHMQADEILLATLDELGKKEIADAYREIREKMRFEYGE